MKFVYAANYYTMLMQQVQLFFSVIRLQMYPCEKNNLMQKFQVDSRLLQIKLQFPAHIS